MAKSMRKLREEAKRIVKWTGRTVKQIKKQHVDEYEKPIRHKLAKTEVEVFRLFKVRDAGQALKCSSDNVIAALGSQIVREASTMLQPYIDEQNKIADLEKIPPYQRES